MGGYGIDVLQGGNGDDLLTDLSGVGLLDGGYGDDRLASGSGRQFLQGGQGDDVISTGSGSDVVVFNRGDGSDVLIADPIPDNTLSLAGGIDYADLTLARQGLDLVLGIGNEDRITFRDWYGVGSGSVANLQMIAETGEEYFDPGSDEPLRNQIITKFDFVAIVRRFDQAMANDPALNAWSMTEALTDFRILGSDTAALGGVLAYQYGNSGSLAGLGVVPALGRIISAPFGVAPQPIASLRSDMVLIS
jgi:hypothetical protein